jgi:saccharopine dehydrogenase (NAD+, L-lysine-forming)
MKLVIGIRREDKNQWERRVPLTPEHIALLIRDHGLEVIVQPSEIRVFPDSDYAKAGAKIQEDLSPCPVVFAVKEIPNQLILPNRTYIFFSHVIKGQKKNMEMLKKMMELKCHIIDYEKILDNKGRRLIFFGWHAGLAGMIETLSAFGKRLAWEEIPNPFQHIQQPYQYQSLDEAKQQIAETGKHIASHGIDKRLCPLVFGIAGYGNVSKGAQEILDLLPVTEIDPGQLQKLTKGKPANCHTLYKVIFKEEHLVKPISPKHRFELQDYYQHPEKYRSKFDGYLPHITVLVNANYWDNRYPRLVTKSGLKELYSQTVKPQLRMIGDLSCDVDGAIECNTHITTPGDPVYVYNPFTGESKSGVGGVGPVVLAVDNLPCEIPEKSSRDFSQALIPFVPAISAADYSVPFEQCDLTQEVKGAVILYQGQLTPDFEYIKKYL